MKRLMNLTPSKPLAIFLSILPFIAVLFIYWNASNVRLAENSHDKLLPSFTQISSALERLAFSEDKRTGKYIFWEDTNASLRRISLGVLISASSGLLIGLLTGIIPLARANLSPVVTVISLIPPMAILPILFISFGLGEFAKVMLIIIGTAPVMIRDMQSRVMQLPAEQLIKAQTLGASTWLVSLRIVLPQILPRLIDSMRLSLGSAWLFLIAAEAIAAQEGLGYRIFLVRRYMSMDVIFPYVIWITLLAFVMDFALKKLSLVAFPWYHDSANDK